MKSLSKCQEIMITQEETYYLLIILSDQNYCKLVGIDLSGEGNASISQQISFTGELEENDDVNIFFFSEKEQKIFH